MSYIRYCRHCGGTIVEPAFEGDGVYQESTCKCPRQDDRENE